MSRVFDLMVTITLLALSALWVDFNGSLIPMGMLASWIGMVKLHEAIYRRGSRPLVSINLKIVASIVVSMAGLMALNSIMLSIG